MVVLISALFGFRSILERSLEHGECTGDRNAGIGCIALSALGLCTWPRYAYRALKSFAPLFSIFYRLAKLFVNKCHSLNFSMLNLAVGKSEKSFGTGFSRRICSERWQSSAHGMSEGPSARSCHHNCMASVVQPWSVRLKIVACLPTYEWVDSIFYCYFHGTGGLSPSHRYHTRTQTHSFSYPENGYRANIDLSPSPSTKVVETLFRLEW